MPDLRTIIGETPDDHGNTVASAMAYAFGRAKADHLITEAARRVASALVSDEAVEAAARASDPVAWQFIDAAEVNQPDHPALPLTRVRQIKQARAALQAAAKTITDLPAEKDATAPPEPVE